MFIGEPPAFVRPRGAAQVRRGQASADDNHAPMADRVQGLSAAANPVPENRKDCYLFD
jgi:hypothetical protein